jgi:hypothetical protein
VLIGAHTMGMVRGTFPGKGFGPVSIIVKF